MAPLFIPGHFVRFGCFPLVLNRINHSDFPKQSLPYGTWENEQLIFPVEAPLVKHTVATNTTILLKLFSYIYIHLRPINICNTFNFPKYIIRFM